MSLLNSGLFLAISSGVGMAGLIAYALSGVLPWLVLPAITAGLTCVFGWVCIMRGGSQ